MSTLGQITSRSERGSAILTVIAPQVIAKVFTDETIFINGVNTLTFNISNPNPVTAPALTGVAFTDTLPTGIVVATPNNLTNTCGGTATAVSTGSTVSLSGATLADGASCSLSVSVLGQTSGDKTNSVSVTSTNGGPGNTSENIGDVPLNYVTVTDPQLPLISTCNWTDGDGVPLTAPITLPVADRFDNQHNR